MGLILEGAVVGGMVGYATGACCGTLTESHEIIPTLAIEGAFSGAAKGAVVGGACGVVLEPCSMIWITNYSATSFDYFKSNFTTDRPGAQPNSNWKTLFPSWVPTWEAWD